MSKKELQKFRKASKLFHQVERRLLARHKGQVVAIEPDSGRYFLGKDVLDAARNAMAAFPGKVFDFFRIGYPAVHKLRRQHHPFFKRSPQRAIIGWCSTNCLSGLRPR